MRVFKLIFKNSWRHKLRTLLTILGIAIALMAYGLISTMIDAWYAGVEASAQNRLVTRSAVSMVMPLPLAYQNKIARVPGVERVGKANWFGAYYKDPKDFFANFAIDTTYLLMYPEFVVPPEQLEMYYKERNACIVGRKLANRYGWKLGDAIQLTGTIYPGTWDFVIRGIYTGAQPNTDETVFMFHWDYVNERMKQEFPGRADVVGWYMMQIASDANAAVVSEQIDQQFKNSFAETLTETERAFQQSFVAMSGTIILALRAISVVVIFIILLVLANTMAMTERERIPEYAVLKALGFRPFHLVGLIAGESLTIAMVGFVVGLVLMIYVCSDFATFVTENLVSFFPVFELQNSTMFWALVAAIVVGIAAAIFPAWRAVRIRTADGLHRLG